MSDDLPSAEALWWARVERAAERQGAGPSSKPMMEWTHAMIVTCSPVDEMVDGHWVQPRPEQHTEEYKRRETRRLCDRLGRELGVGPMP